MTIRQGSESVKRRLGPLTKVAAPLRAQVVGELRKAISGLVFEPGERLMERDLCEAYGVSRTVVREALRVLEADGLVRVLPNKGPIVAPITVTEARFIYEIRAALEGLSGTLFAERADDASVANLAQCAEAVADAAASGDMAKLLRAKDAFYTVLLRGASNELILPLLQSFHIRVTLLRRLSLTAEGRVDQSVIELREIVEAVTARDANRARDACVRHVQSAAAAAFARLSEDMVTDDAVLNSNMLEKATMCK